MRVGINGFGRMGRLGLRAAWGNPALEFVAINEPNATADVMATLLEFDSIHGRWNHACEGEGDELRIDGTPLAYTRFDQPGDIPWRDLGVDLVLESSGAFKTAESLEPHFVQGASRVVVARAIKGGTPNIVLGVNDGEFDLAKERLVTAASCTTNCLAPAVKVLHDAIGIERGTVTTIHDPTNTQVVVDRWHKDARRARAAQLNLIPTTSNSAYAVTLVIPELEGKLDSMAVRVPVLNASLTDCNFHMRRETTAEEVNAALQAASLEGPLSGILGYEERPLVSSDYARDPRSGIVDALSTRVVDGRMVKLIVWYDNEFGYANRWTELAAKVAAAEAARAQSAG
ncbi:MAG: ArsJ-associated glyceraldehyde-3-phosphate dehydrogenase [Planctomycetota bacterium]|nr:ArsJ-associated glyceraldehyde-3-phosphate dehydrogenase [Planctomycetota bacterium]